MYRDATAMIIIDADRFGLAQLHQLRGACRVGEVKASYCILVANPKNEVGKERMKIMTQTNNGFVVSQKDLELRGLRRSDLEIVNQALTGLSFCRYCG